MQDRPGEAQQDAPKKREKEEKEEREKKRGKGEKGRTPYEVVPCSLVGQGLAIDAKRDILDCSGILD